MKNYLSVTRQKSGSIKDDDPLIAFLYILLRDHVTAGVVDDVMKKLVEEEGENTGNFTNGWLACHAMHVREQINLLRKDKQKK